MQLARLTIAITCYYGRRRRVASYKKSCPATQNVDCVTARARRSDLMRKSEPFRGVRVAFPLLCYISRLALRGSLDMMLRQIFSSGTHALVESDSKGCPRVLTSPTTLCLSRLCWGRQGSREEPTGLSAGVPPHLRFTYLSQLSRLAIRSRPGEWSMGSGMRQQQLR